MQYGLYKDPVGILLILYSIAAVALIVERMLLWKKVKSQTRALSAELPDMLTSPDRQKLKGAFADGEAPLAEVMSHVLKHDTSESPETTLLLLDDALDEVASRYRKNLVLLAALAGTAPFLGLLGTVLGIMRTFVDIMQKGFGGPTVIAFGISQALQTTAAGLVIAIPTFIAFNLLNNAANRAVRDLRMQANRIFVALGDL